MPTRRMIEPAIWQSESMGRLSIRQRLMFIGMFSNADDQGRLRASAPVIRSMIFPFDDITLSEIESDILQIQAADCIMLYEVDGSRFAQLINWWKYQQHQWAYPSHIPKPNNWADRLRFKKAGKVITENWGAEAETFSQSPSIDQYRVGKGLGKSLGKSLGKEQGKARREKPPKDGAEKAPRPRDPLFDAIAQVTCTDPATAGASIGKIESTLKKANPPYTPDEVLEFGNDWPDWKDKPPTLWQLKEQIGIVRQNGSGKKKPVKNQIIKQVTPDHLETLKQQHERLANTPGTAAYRMAHQGDGEK